jgi:glutathionylspermidine synthase
MISNISTNPLGSTFSQLADEAGVYYAVTAEEQTAFQERFYGIHPDYPKVSYPPPLFSPKFLTALNSDAAALVVLLRSIPERFFNGEIEKWLTFLTLPRSANERISSFLSRRWLQRATLFARPDFILTRSGYSLVEINVGPSVGGLGTCDKYFEYLQHSQFAQHFKRMSKRLSCINMGDIWEQCIRAHSNRRDVRGRPRFFAAVADPLEVDADFMRDFIEMVESKGYEVERGCITDLDVSGKVYFSGRDVQIIYCCFTYPELLSHGIPQSLIQTFAEADERGIVDFFSPPIYIIFDNKANLELLSNERHSNVFSSGELELIRRCVPYTVRLNAANRPMIVAEKNTFVLKPALQFGGQGVIIGENVSRTDWEIAIDAALRNGESWVAQHCIRDIWSYAGSGAHADGRLSVCLGPTIFNGEAGGVLLRESPYKGTASVINVAQGAALGTAISIDDAQ